MADDNTRPFEPDEVSPPEGEAPHWSSHARPSHETHPLAVDPDLTEAMPDGWPNNGNDIYRGQGAGSVPADRDPTVVMPGTESPGSAPSPDTTVAVPAYMEQPAPADRTDPVPDVPYSGRAVPVTPAASAMRNRRIEARPQQRRRRRGVVGPILALLAAILAVAGLAWWLLVGSTSPVQPPAVTPPSDAATVPTTVVPSTTGRTTPTTRATTMSSSATTRPTTTTQRPTTSSTVTGPTKTLPPISTVPTPTVRP